MDTWHQTEEVAMGTSQVANDDAGTTRMSDHDVFPLGRSRPPEAKS
jgi:hypothetical protein